MHHSKRFPHLAVLAMLCSACNVGSKSLGYESEGTSDESGGDDPNPLDGEPVLPPEPQSLPPSAPGIAVAGSGTRLRPVVLQADDAMSFLTWHDTALGVDCEFVVTANGLRCLPSSTIVSGDGPSCQEPVAPVFDSDPLGQIVVDYESGNCAVRYRAWRVTGDRREPNPACYGGDGFPPVAIRSLTPISDEEFVAGQLVTDEAATLGEVRLEAEDGAWRLIGAAHGDAPCDLREYDGQSVCLDVRGMMGVCGSSTAVIACDPIAQAIRYDECSGEIIAVHAVGTPTNAAPMCGEWWAEALLFSAGDVIEPAALPIADDALLGSGRIRVRAIADAEGAIRWPQHHLGGGPWDTLFDTRLGVSCHAYATTDGPITCMPSLGIGYPQGVFSDPSCTIPAYEGTWSLDGPEACEGASYRQMDPIIGMVWTAEQERQYHGVELHEGPLYRREDYDACNETSMPLGVTHMYRPVGGPLPDDFFAEVHRVTLP